MARSNAATNETQSALSLVSADLPQEDAADRAFRKRKGCWQRIDTDRIGFWPGNRVGTGVNSYHVHEVAEDCMQNKVRINRYSPVELVEVPEPLLKKFKVDNERKIANDPLMPRYSPAMEFVPISKTHFTHACKLVNDGTHTLFDKGQKKIRWRSDDTEGLDISRNGVMAVIYDKSIWDDPEAVAALCATGNMNSQIDQGEDEMQTFGRACQIFSRMSESNEWRGRDIPVCDILQEVKNCLAWDSSVKRTG